MNAVMKGDALGLHLLDAAVDDVFFHLEVGNAVAQQAARLGEFLEHMHVMAGACELLRAGEARGARADDGDLLVGPVRGDLRLQPAVVPGAIDNGAFDGFDRDRIVVDVERAGGLAWRRTDAPRELGEIVGRMQVARGLFPVALIHEVVEVRDLVVDRTTGRARRDRAGAVAIGDAAVHATRGLVARLFLRERHDEFVEMLHALGDRRVLPVVALDFQKTCDLTHSKPDAPASYVGLHCFPSLRGAKRRSNPHFPCCSMDCFASLAMTICWSYAPIAIFGSASAFALNSRRARRYSTGITLRNFGSQCFQFARISAARREPVALAWRVIRMCSRSISASSRFLNTSTRPWASRSPE